MEILLSAINGHGMMERLPIQPSQRIHIQIVDFIPFASALLIRQDAQALTVIVMPI